MEEKLTYGQLEELNSDWKMVYTKEDLPKEGEMIAMYTDISGQQQHQLITSFSYDKVFGDDEKYCMKNFGSYDFPHPYNIFAWKYVQKFNRGY